MNDQPDAPALLDAVAALLRDSIVPLLDGPAAYQARIAASITAIVARELRARPADTAAEHASLLSLLDEESGDIADLNRILAARLRDGSLHLDQPEVAAHVWRTTLAKIAVDQPRYARLRQITDEDKT